MAIISSRVFGYTPDKYLLLQGDEWCRPLGALGNWQRIRLGILVALRPNGVNTINDGQLLMGLCSSRSFTASGSISYNNVGISVPGTMAPGTAHNWTYTTASGNPTYNPNANIIAYRRYFNPASGMVLVTASPSGFPYLSVAGVGIRRRRMPIILDITRSYTTGLYSIGAYHAATSTTDDYTAGNLLDACDQQGTPSIAGQTVTWTAIAPVTLVATELTGTLDTFTVYWSNHVYGLELYAACGVVLQDQYYECAHGFPSFGGAYDLLLDATAGTAAGLNGGAGWAGPYAFQGTA